MNTYQPSSTNILRRTIVVLSAIIGFSLMAVGSVHASSGTLGGHWLVELTFPNDEPSVELRTEIWFKPTNGSPYLVSSQTEALTCTITGNLQVNAEIATFTGQEYISCTLPNMSDKFEEVSAGALSGVPSNVLARKPFVGGQLSVGGSNPGATLPVFHHPTIQYGLVRTSAAQAQQVFQVDGATTSSSSFVQAAPYDLLAALKIRPNGTYRTEFTANGVSGPGVPANLGSGLFINMEETAIYFGYSPDSGSYFEGSIKTLTVDPGVFGRD